MKRNMRRSLFRRLLFGFLSVMLTIWLCALAWDMHETKTTARVETVQEAKGLCRQILVFMRIIAERPEDMPRVIHGMDMVRSALYQERGLYAERMQIQVWQGKKMVYTSSPELAAEVPSVNPPNQTVDNPWVVWVEHDPESRLTVRVAQEVVGQWMLTISSIGYYFLPLLYSFPFLLVPAWFIIKVGLRPLKSIVTEIEDRSAADLSALGPSPYMELSPLVSSVNHLMERLTQRLDREQEFLVDAAHELKTPLAVIQINAESLINEPNPVYIKEAHEGLRQGVSRATHTVHQLLAFARSGADRDTVDFQPLNLVELVRTRMALAAQLAFQRGIEIELQSPEDCILPLHRETIASLIDNLLSNAVKYSPDGGRIMVRVSVEAGRVQLTVADEGPGIPVELYQKVFERFFRLPGQDQAGSGLGLSIAERSAERNRATIHLDSGLGGLGLSVIVDFQAEGNIGLQSANDAQPAIAGAVSEVS
jgi:signal transduction histidine kinase